jgi:signal-transduction protein with cAMP-binding, CBS, and nucleotidyltransferase domain
VNVAEDLIRDKDRALVSVDGSVTIGEGIKLMARENVGCLLVSGSDGKIEGIWTERDLVHNIADNGFGLESHAISRYMSSPVLSCRWDDSVYSLMDKFLGLRIRHILVEKDGDYIGLLSVGDVMKSVIRAKDHDLAQANSKLSWDYYEEWMYKPQT